MENEYLVNVLKRHVKQLVIDKVESMIDEEVEKFREQLEDNKDQYIAEIMKGIKIYHNENIMDHCIDYRIVFENVTKIEPKRNKVLVEEDLWKDERSK